MEKRLIHDPVNDNLPQLLTALFEKFTELETIIDQVENGIGLGVGVIEEFFEIPAMHPHKDTTPNKPTKNHFLLAITINISSPQVWNGKSNLLDITTSLMLTVPQGIERQVQAT